MKHLPKALILGSALIASAYACADSSPETFGAKGDGNTDDTSAVTQAIAKGGTVTLGSGKTYLVTGPIKIGSNVTLTSDGTKPAVLRFAAPRAGSMGITSSNAKNVSFKNVVFESKNNDLNTLVAFYSADHVNIANCTFRKDAMTSAGLLRLKDSTNVTIDKSEFSQGYEAIEIYGNSDGVTISNNNVHGVVQYGIRVEGSADTASSNINILNNKVYDVVRPPGQTAGHLIYVHIGNGVSKARHKNVVVEGNQLKGIDKAFVDGGNGDLIEYCDVDGGRVSKNRVEYGGDVGIGVVRSSGILIEDNDAGYNNTNGIALWEASNCRILNNRAYNNNQDRAHQWANGKQFKGGIRIMARNGTSNDNEITGNKCWDDQPIKTQDYGIYLMKTAKNTKVGKNQLGGNKFGDLRDDNKNGGLNLLQKRR
jgi:parallel beta-helix repeat protein